MRVAVAVLLLTGALALARALYYVVYANAD
jgi:hypothetical protein